MRVALYARVSTESQQARGTIGSQLAVLRERVTVEGDEPVAEFCDDGHSGARLDRPGLDALRDAAEAGLIERVWCLFQGVIASGWRRAGGTRRGGLLTPTTSASSMAPTSAFSTAANKGPAAVGCAGSEQHRYGLDRAHWGSGGRGGSGRALGPTEASGSSGQAFALFRGGGPPGDRTPNPRIKSAEFTRAEQYYLSIVGSAGHRNCILGTVRPGVVGQFVGQHPRPSTTDPPGRSGRRQAGVARDIRPIRLNSALRVHRRGKLSADDPPGRSAVDIVIRRHLQVNPRRQARLTADANRGRRMGSTEIGTGAAAGMIEQPSPAVLSTVGESARRILMLG